MLLSFCVREDEVKAVREIALGADDKSVVKVAVDEGGVLVTQDFDMGHIYYFSKRGELGVIVIRPRIQTVGNLKRILEDFLPDIEKRGERALHIVEETGYRVRR